MENQTTVSPQNTFDPRLLAIYLPQFHPIAENDQWWGKGFTEWTNVTKAKPLFPWHYQPHLPADLGFTDLRVPEVRQAQADLARHYGIHGFCYYHYWFNGKRLLERPFNEVLASGEPDFPFCLCWANENWTRAWEGDLDKILLHQNYSVEDDREHMRWLATAFADHRYIRVDGKPLFLVYRASNMDDSRRTTDTWREEAHRLGIGDLFLCRFESVATERVGTPREWGFDAGVEWAPEWPEAGDRVGYWGRKNKLKRMLRLISENYERNNVFNYNDLARRAMSKDMPDYEIFRSVTPSWDNTPRRTERAFIWEGSTPERYGEWLTTVLDQTRSKPTDHQLVFINAWNEWAEGNHLEPCRKFAHGYLEATRKALIDARRNAR